MNKLEIKSQNPSIVLLELDLTVLLSHFGNEPRYRPIIRFPFVDRDTALVVDADVPAREVLDLIQSFNSDVIEESAIFDVYQGDSIGVGKKSIAFRIRYRAADRRLTDEEVEAIHKSLVTYIAEKTGGKIRQ
jgi:phenylalanyl-tRNA synthetase beta chain